MKIEARSRYIGDCDCYKDSPWSWEWEPIRTYELDAYNISCGAQKIGENPPMEIYCEDGYTRIVLEPYEVQAIYRDWKDLVDEGAF